MRRKTAGLAMSHFLDEESYCCLGTEWQSRILGIARLDTSYSERVQGTKCIVRDKRTVNSRVDTGMDSMTTYMVD